MPKSKKSIINQMRSAVYLTITATKQVTTIVQTVHQTITSGPELLGKPLEQVTKLLTNPIFESIHSVTDFTGSGLDKVLEKIQNYFDRPAIESNALLAALNGVIGDHLLEINSPLATSMVICHQEQTVAITKKNLAVYFSNRTKVLILIHGSSLNENSWSRNNKNFGYRLGQKLDFLPLFVRYNTGRHISDNGKDLARMIERLYSLWPQPILEIAIIGHSMGGLVARSAIHYAQDQKHSWIKSVKNLVTLGTPHQGAPLERGGNFIEQLLGATPYSAPFANLGKLRSAGVTDLRYGNIIEEHWQGFNRFSNHGDLRKSIQLPQNINCFAVAATSSKNTTEKPKGDGLVPVDSALGRHPKPELNLNFIADHCWIAPETTHLGILDNEGVYSKLLEWLSPHIDRSSQMN